MKKNILIVDSRPQMLAALSGLFSEYQTETMQSAMGALSLINTTRYTPDLCILNIYSPDDPNVWRLVKELRDREIAVVFLGAEEEKTVTSYAGDLITRPFDLPELLRRIDRLLEPATNPTLTARQREILTFVAHGVPDLKIAQMLAISTNTIKWHVKCASQRVGARSRIHLISIAISRGLIKID